MLEQYTKELTELADWYIRTKELVIEVEGLDKKSYIQPLHELRYSYDHLMRAIIYELDADDEANIKAAISSAKAHLIRAYSDCIEWLLVTVRDELNRVLRIEKSVFAFDEIVSVMPEYEGMRGKIQELTEAVSAYKINKRMEKSEKFDATDKKQNPLLALCGEDGFFDAKYAKLLRGYYDIILEREPKFSRLKRCKVAKSIFWKIAVPMITAVISGVVVYLITK